MLKQYRQAAESRKQTSLVSSTSASDKDPNENVIDTANGAIENVEENVEISCSHSATHGIRTEPYISNSQLSRRRQTDELKLENLRVEKEAEQRLRKLKLEQEQDEMELRR